MAQSLDSHILSLTSVDAGPKNSVKNQASAVDSGGSDSFARVFDQQRERAPDASAGAAAERQTAEAGGKDLPAERPGTAGEAAASQGAAEQGAAEQGAAEQGAAESGTSKGSPGDTARDRADARDRAETGQAETASGLVGAAVQTAAPTALAATAAENAAQALVGERVPGDSGEGPDSALPGALRAGAGAGTKGSAAASAEPKAEINAEISATGGASIPGAVLSGAALDTAATAAGKSPLPPSATSTALSGAEVGVAPTAAAAAGATRAADDLGARLAHGRRERVIAGDGNAPLMSNTASTGPAADAVPVRSRAGAELSAAAALEAAADAQDPVRGAAATTRVDTAAPTAVQPAVAGLAPTTTAAVGGSASSGTPGEWVPEYALEHSPDDAEFPGELSTRLKLLLRDGVREARLQLHPAELGRLQVSVSTDGDQARVSFVADTAAARDAIEQSMPRLREMLEQNGLQLAQSDVEQRDLGQRGDGDASSEPTALADAAEDPADVDGAGNAETRLRSGLVDTYI